MAVLSRPQRLSLPVAPLVAGVIGVLTAAMFAAVPTELLESMVVDSGIASVLSAAEPPLGVTARAVLVLLCGGSVALVAWFALFLLFGSRTIVLQGAGGASEAAPVLRRADAHPDAPSRRPLFATTDLGTPFLEVRARPVHLDAADMAPVAEVRPVAPPPAERPLPDDLDQPLSAYDPAALPRALPEAPVAALPLSAAPEPAAPQPLPRRQTFDAGERFETFPLTPMVRTAPPPTDAPLPIGRPLPVPETPRADPSETIHALLDRLERVVIRRGTEAAFAPPAPPADTIEDTLSTLRRMAMGGN